MTVWRWLVLLAVLALLTWAGFGMIALHRGETAAEQLQVAQAQYREGDPEAAADTARQVLAQTPSQGQAFGLLARALEGDGSDDQKVARYEIAARRAPRDAQVRAWLAAHYLQAGDPTRALVQIDALLTVAPGSRREVLETTAQLAQNEEFAQALAAHLAGRPQWRPAILRAVIAQKVPAASDNLHEALRDHGELTAAETSRWIDGMLADGRWGMAYARWVSGLPQAATSIPALYNGDFANAPSSAGFDWRIRQTNGVLVDRVAGPDGGHAARLTFLGRSVARPGLEHPLLLAPGQYRLDLRARAPDLRSDQGLEWTLTCSDGRTRIGAGARMQRSPGWAAVSWEFRVPDVGCEGQWLRLVNPAPRGVAQTLRGELHLASFAITRGDSAGSAPTRQP